MCGEFKAAWFWLLPQASEGASDSPYEVSNQTRVGRHPPPMLQQQLEELPSVSPTGPRWVVWERYTNGHAMPSSGSERKRVGEQEEDVETGKKEKAEREGGERLYTRVALKRHTFSFLLTLLYTICF